MKKKTRFESVTERNGLRSETKNYVKGCMIISWVNVGLRWMRTMATF